MYRVSHKKVNLAFFRAFKQLDLYRLYKGSTWLKTLCLRLLKVSKAQTLIYLFLGDLVEINIFAIATRNSFSIT